MARSEAKTRRELIDPKLKESGWFEHDWQVETGTPLLREEVI